ncbi:MAG: hypothetical protein AAFX44_06110 [Pseudomonadota bacterium]
MARLELSELKVALSVLDADTNLAVRVLYRMHEISDATSSL